jgi:hypothetical protein
MDNRKTYMALLLGPVIMGLAGCFEEDLRVTPHTPGDENTFAWEKSIYTTQSYFDLGTNSIMKDNDNGEWVLRFGSQTGDWHVGVNSADYWGVYNSMTREMDSVGTPALEDWIFDRSSGDPDSTAFAGWVRFAGEDTLYSGYLYLLGKYDGIGYTPLYALQFLSVDASGYVFRIMDWPDGNWTEYEVPKESAYNYQYMSAGGSGEVLTLEPDRNMWDLHFTQYGSIIYTNDGIPTPYYVRGVLLNRNGVAAALDSVVSFADITYEDIATYSFSTREDLIGYEWKSVEVDVNSNTAVYTVNTDFTYIIRDTEGFYHKLRFVLYYNDLGEKGYPVIEHTRL